MTKTPRLIGYMLMAATLVAALGTKQGWFTGFGPVPAAAVAIILGAAGLLVVMTDMMVRAMMKQSRILAEVQRQEEEKLQAEAAMGEEAGKPRSGAAEL